MPNHQQSDKTKQSPRSRRRSGDRPQIPSRSPSSNFGDDEIGGTSFDPGPVRTEAKGRDERIAKKASGTTTGTDNKK
jgi:hypothetical protein